MKKLQKYLPGLLMFAVLLASLAGGAAYAKYVTQKQFDGSVTIKAELGTITLQEHTANRKEDGSYELLTTTTDKNEYIIIPGLDVPKDPFVTVQRASSIPVYVFVEVVGALDSSAVSFEIDDANWKKISASENNGKHGGTVYVYTGGGDGPKIVTQNSDFTSPVYILKENKVIIGQELLHDTPSNLGLTFYASMGHIAADGEQLADVYNRIT